MIKLSAFFCGISNHHYNNSIFKVPKKRKIRYSDYGFISSLLKEKNDMFVSQNENDSRRHFTFFSI